MPNKIKVDIVEKRAPTDESVKLLREMEEKITANIISMSKIEDNIFNIKWYILSDQYSWEDTCKCIFTLNGKEYDFKFLLPSKYTDTSQIIPKIREMILEKLTNVLGQDLLRNCENALINHYKR